MKMLISEHERVEIDYHIMGDCKPSDKFWEALENKDDAIKIWKMLPVAFLEVNRFITKI